MASTTSLEDALRIRRTNYTLSAESTISNSRIVEIVGDAIMHVPSTYNVQSARAVVLLGDAHRRVWGIIEEHMEAVVPSKKWTAYLRPKIQGHLAAYGTVLWFEDKAPLDELGAKNPSSAHVLSELSDHSTGMHQFYVWMALETEGLGANLQHYNANPSVSKAIRQTWDLPETWVLKAQLVFGRATSEPRSKDFKPLEERVKIFSA